MDEAGATQNVGLSQSFWSLNDPSDQNRAVVFRLGEAPHVVTEGLVAVEVGDLRTSPCGAQISPLRRCKNGKTSER